MFESCGSKANALIKELAAGRPELAKLQLVPPSVVLKTSLQF
jgi:hypothetical protein